LFVGRDGTPEDAAGVNSSLRRISEPQRERFSFADARFWGNARFWGPANRPCYARCELPADRKFFRISPPIYVLL
jgi:hypothetical protein